MAIGDDTDIFTNAQRFEEQCFFMDNIEFFLKNHGAGAFGYRNFVKSKISGDQDSSAFYNKVTIPKGTDKFLNITPAQAAALVPRIRLYKVVYPDAKSKGTSYELIFKNYLTEESLSAITSDRTGRGAGAGIKSFSWENKGESQATANRIFESKLELYFQDFDALNTEQKARSPDGSKTADISFLDLIVPQPTITPSNKVWNIDYFRIKISVGWEIPNEKTLASGVSFSSDDKDAIESSGKVFFLNLKSHELNFNPDGQISLSIDYIGGTESVLASPDADILRLPSGDEAGRAATKAKGKLQRLKDKKRIISKNNCKGKTDLLDKTIQDATEEYNKAQATADQTRYENFVNYLYALGPKGTLNPPTPRMMYIDVPTEVLEEYAASKVQDEAKTTVPRPDLSGLSADKTGFLKPRGDEGRDRLLAAARSNAGPPPGGATEILKGITDPGPEVDDHQRMIYTTFGNILEAAFYAVNNSNVARREIRTMVGMISIPDLRTGDVRVVNIADIPVSYKMFSTWFFNVCISKNMKEWRFKKFLQEASKTLLRSVIKAKCFDEDLTSGLEELDLKIETLDLPQLSNGSDPIIPGAKTVAAFNLTNEIQISGIDDPTEHYKSDNTNINSYLLIYGKQTRPNKFHYQGTETRQSEDKKKKVFHFRMGQDRGLVKNINFSRTDIPYAKEARLASSANQSSDILKLREVYDVSITLYGNTIWSPGALIYVDVSSQFGNKTSLATKMGLQAYYRVISTSSFVENGKYEVTLKAKYEFSGLPGIDGQEDSATATTCPPPSTRPTSSTSPLPGAIPPSAGGAAAG